MSQYEPAPAPWITHNCLWSYPFLVCFLRSSKNDPLACKCISFFCLKSLMFCHIFIIQSRPFNLSCKTLKDLSSQPYCHQCSLTPDVHQQVPCIRFRGAPCWFLWEAATRLTPQARDSFHGVSASVLLLFSFCRSPFPRRCFNSLLSHLCLLCALFDPSGKTSLARACENFILNVIALFCFYV